jgi:hypothetical protein
MQMKALLSWKTLVIAGMLIVGNVILVTQVTGLSYAVEHPMKDYKKMDRHHQDRDGGY